MMTKCIACDGTKHRFKEVIVPGYKSLTRIYLGPCNVCNAVGKVRIAADLKQKSSGDSPDLY